MFLFLVVAPEASALTMTAMNTRQLNALKKKFANVDPTAALFSGRVLLGYLLHDHGDDDRCAAMSADHQMIGDFATRTEARRAHHRVPCQIVHRFKLWLRQRNISLNSRRNR
jgi:hypothetical protein